ncbi:MAG: radical SAM protein [archaeon]
MVVGRLFLGGERAYFSIYPEFSNLHMGLPPETEDYFVRCANVHFNTRTEGAKHNRRVGIDIFLLKDNKYAGYAQNALSSRFKPRHNIPSLHIENTPELIDEDNLEKPLNQRIVDASFGIEYRIKQEFSGLADEIVRIARADINQFLANREKPLPENRFTGVKILGEILQPVSMKRLDNAVIKLGTKAKTHPFCYQDLAINFGTGCIANEEIVEVPDIGEVHLFNPWLGCDYCYNKWLNRRPFSYSYHPAEFQDLVDQMQRLKQTDFKGKKKKIRALRIASGTEAFNKELIQEALTVIEAANSEDIPVIFTTKTPYFDKGLAKFFKQHRVSLMVSYGSDELELGLAKQGYTNKHRFELARQYHEFRSDTFKVVNYTLMDLSQPPWMQKLWSANEAYRINRAEGIPLQFLIFRTSDKKLLGKITDTPIAGAHVRGQRQLVSLGGLDKPNYFIKSGENYYTPLHIHPYYENIMRPKNAKNEPTLGMCSVMQKKSACAACFVPELPRLYGVQKKIPLPGGEKRKKDRLKRAEKAMEKHLTQAHRKQKKLF